MIEIRSLRKTFRAAHREIHALTDLSFQVKPGEIVGFVGSNGAGKSTAMRIILGVLQADSGQVYWDGHPLGEADRFQIGYMPEERGLYPTMKVADQLIYFAQLHNLSAAAARQAMERWTETLNLTARRQDLVEKLSLGNQQRVQLAAALVHNPRLLVLDEPFSGLDPVAVQVMSRTMREYAQSGAAVLFSSHQLDLVEKLCDRVVIIANGKLVTEGTVTELRRTDTPTYYLRPAAATSLQTLETTLSALPEISEVSPAADAEGPRLRLELTAAPQAPQRVLAAATQVGPLTEFVRYRPSLSELFASVVKTDSPEESPQDKQTDHPNRKKSCRWWKGGRK